MVWRDLCDWRAGRVIAITCAYARIDRLSRRFRCHHGPVRRHAGRQRALSSRTHSYRPATERGLCADPPRCCRLRARHRAIRSTMRAILAARSPVPRSDWSCWRSGRRASRGRACAGLLQRLQSREWRCWPTPPSPSRTVIIAFSTKLIPSDKLPQTNAEMSAHAAELIARYPREPRPRYLLAAELLDGRRGKTGSRRPFRRSSLAPDIASTTCR